MEPSEKLMATSKYQAIGGMRRVFSYCELTKYVREQALSPYKGVRGGKRYTCASCEDHFGIADTVVDHIEPMIPLDKTYKDLSLDVIHERMFCSTDNLQLLCKGCHKEKSNAENAQRRALKPKKAKKSATTKVKSKKAPKKVSKELSEETTAKKAPKKSKVTFDKTVKFKKK